MNKTSFDFQALEHKVNALFEPCNHPHEPGAYAMVKHQDHPPVGMGFGGMDLSAGTFWTDPGAADRPFRFGSIAKHITAVCALILEDRGLINLEDDVHDYLPDLPNFGAAVTLRQMLSCTAGLKYEETALRLAGSSQEALLSKQARLNLIRRSTGLNFEPGSQVFYCCTGFVLMTEIIERVSGQSYNQFTKENIFAPLGMHASGNSHHFSETIVGMPPGYMKWPDGSLHAYNHNIWQGGDGCLVSTANDFLLWNEMLRSNALDINDFHQRLLTPAPLSTGVEAGYALGAIVAPYRGRPVIAHAGNTTTQVAHFVRFPKEDLFVLVIGNGSHIQSERLSYKIADLVFDQSGLESPPIIKKPIENPEYLFGLYGDEDSGYVISLGPNDGSRTDKFAYPVMATFGFMKNVLEQEADGLLATRGRSSFTIRVIGNEDGAKPNLDVQVDKKIRRFKPQLSNFKLNDLEMDALCGSYYNKDFNVIHRIYREDNTLVFQLGSGLMLQQRLVMEPVLPDVFYANFWARPEAKAESASIPSYDESYNCGVKVLRGEDGAVSGLLVSSGAHRKNQFEKIA